MPPATKRKRLLSPSEAPPYPKRATLQRKAKPSIFADFDNESSVSSPADAKAFLDALSDDDDSSLSEADSEDFENVLPTPPPKRQKTEAKKRDTSDSEEELEFEDVEADAQDAEGLVIPEIPEDFSVAVKEPGDVQHTRLTLKPGAKTAATKKMRQARILAHSMHVQLLLWHNVIRNIWINDREVQDVLVQGLGDALKAEVARWRVAMGYEVPAPKRHKKRRKEKSCSTSHRERIREWGADSERSDQATQGDPLNRLLKYLAAYWKKRFRVTAPSLRKIGYRDPRSQREAMDSFQNELHDPEKHGERIETLDDFRACARDCRGSRDVGAQLFTALLRGLGIEARLVASLQPTGFGWSKVEEAHPINGGAETVNQPVAAEIATNGCAKAKAKRDNSSAPGTLDSATSGLSDAPSSAPETDDDLVIISERKRNPGKKYDCDLRYPTYWTEALSPISNTYVPVSTILHPSVCTAPDHIFNFEPKGAAAQKAKQVICYVVAYASDGTAKDVTVRYLSKRLWPGKTKGFRLPPERVPVYDKNGKVVRHEEYDWFKRVMRDYARPGPKRTLADDIEDQGDLVPAVPIEDARKKKAEPETLQGYKESAKFVLERHLRREEALLPSAKPVKYFHGGKGEKATKEAVYLRSDVVSTKSAETWHKEGRQVRLGEKPLKQVPYRAVTLQRKREIEDTAREAGEKPLQGLFAGFQTEWIIPEPIGEDRRIPKNVFGNIDVYVPSMVPAGAVHIPLRKTAGVCKKLGIDFAEACTGFEFGKQRAVPVLTGVVVAEENEAKVLELWKEEEETRAARDNKKREELVLALWKKFCRGLRIRERMAREYGSTGADGKPDWKTWTADAVGPRRAEVYSGVGAGDPGGGEDESGGFLRDGEDDNFPDLTDHAATTLCPDERIYGAHPSGGFLPESDGDPASRNGGFEIVGGSQKIYRRRRPFSDSSPLDAEVVDRDLSRPKSLAAMLESADSATSAVIVARTEITSSDLERQGQHDADDVRVAEAGHEPLQTRAGRAKGRKRSKQAGTDKTERGDKSAATTERQIATRASGKTLSPYFYG